MTTIASSSTPIPSSSTSTTTKTQTINTNTNSELDSETLKAAIFQRLHPRVYLERFLAENVRPDGRVIGFIDNRMGGEGEELENGIWRDVSINVGSINTADGSALVRMGGTTIVCGVKAEIAEPDLETPDEGFLVSNIDLPAMCHPRFKPGPPSDEAQVLSERLYEVLTSSNFISPKSLVIHPAKSVWTLYVDATCINYDGNVFDAALLAMVSALLNMKLPKAVYDEDTNKTTCYRTQKAPIIQSTSTSTSWKKNLPISTSFGLFDSKNVLADPTAFEEPLLESTLSIVMNGNEGLLSLIQQGLGGVNAEINNGNGADGVVNGCIVAAKKRSLDLVKIISDAVDFGV